MSPGWSFLKASIEMVALAECAAGDNGACHTKCHPWHFFELGLFLKLFSRCFHQTQSPSSLNGCCSACPLVGSMGPSLCLAVFSLSQHVGTLGLPCLHDFYSDPCTSQDPPKTLVPPGGTGATLWRASMSKHYSVQTCSAALSAR